MSKMIETVSSFTAAASLLTLALACALLCEPA